MKTNFIKVGSLLTLSAVLLFGQIGLTQAADSYTLQNKTEVYLNADDASKERNSVKTYNSGKYYVYKEYNGMINITKVPGQAGAWIKPNSNNVSKKETVVKNDDDRSDKFKLKSSTKGYMNADDARKGVYARTTLSSGTYYVYKEYNGILNLTKVKGQPGAWVNPEGLTKVTEEPKKENKVEPKKQPKKKTKKENKPVKEDSTDKYKLKSRVSGYMNADNAKRGVYARTTLSTGTYYIYKEYNGMLNLTKTKGQPGAWVNPNAKQTKNNTNNTPKNTQTTAKHSLRDLQYHGIINWGGYKFTYYSQQVLPGGGLRIPGRHVNANGYVADKDGYIVVAHYSKPMGTVINTPFGNQAKVYDRCGNCSFNHYDIYTR